MGDDPARWHATQVRRWRKRSRYGHRADVGARRAFGPCDRRDTVVWRQASWGRPFPSCARCCHGLSQRFFPRRLTFEKGLILVASKLDQLGSLLHDLTVEQQAIISQVTERPTTWLVPDINKRIPIWIKGQHQQVAIRLSRHPLTARLCEETGSLLVSTSANESGEETLDNAKAIQKRLGKGLALILDGSLGGETQASEIKDLKTGKVFR